MAIVTGNVILKAKQFESLAPAGTPPLVVASTTVVTDLNADLLDGFHATAFGQLAQANRWTAQQTFDLAPLPQTHLGPALGSASRRFNNVYTGGIDASGNATIAGTLGVTGSITGTLATAAQPNITSLGTLASLTVSGVGRIAGVQLTDYPAGAGGVGPALEVGLGQIASYNRSTATYLPFRILSLYLSIGQGSTEWARFADGILSLGTAVTTGAGSKSIVTANATSTPAAGGGLYGVNPAGTGTIPLIYCDQYGKVQLGGGAASVATYYGAPYGAGAAQDGTFMVDGSTPGRFWIYAGGNRYYVTGTLG